LAKAAARRQHLERRPPGNGAAVETAASAQDDDSTVAEAHARYQLALDENGVGESPGLGARGIEEAPAWRRRLIERQNDTWQAIRALGDQPRHHLSERATCVLDDAIHWLSEAPESSIHAIVTDPPYGLIEYEEQQLAKRASGRGGVWRIPPAFDGASRSPLPRFTVLSEDALAGLHAFFVSVAYVALRALVPGGHVLVASNPLLSTMCFHAFQEGGFEKRGEFIRQVQTLRGGDRPKGAEAEFPDVSVMPRSCWEPWGIFRKPFDRTVADNLRLWGAGGLRRMSPGEPLKDLIFCSPTRGAEREIAPHPSLKPQRFMRQVVRAALPLGIGIVYDPFAGSGSTLAAAEALGYLSVGTERSQEYFDMSRTAFRGLVDLEV
jgi:site-specific DNA-methyltransferase (adenine-specific)